MNSPYRQSSHWAALAFSLLVLAVIIVAVMLFPEHWIPVRQWGAALESAGLPGKLLFLLLGSLATSAGFPRQLLAFTGGLAYGLYTGLALSWLAALCGCHITVQISKGLLRDRIERRYPAVIATLTSLLQHDTFIKVLILRLQPLGTNLLTNICIGFTQVSYPRFLLATAIGFVPQMVVFGLLGAGVRVGEATQTLVSSILVMISLMLAAGVYLRHRQRKKETVSVRGS